MANGDIVTFSVRGIWRTRVEGGEVFPETFYNYGQAVWKGRAIAKSRGVDHRVIAEEQTPVTRAESSPARRDDRVH